MSTNNNNQLGMSGLIGMFVSDVQYQSRSEGQKMLKNVD